MSADSTRIEHMFDPIDCVDDLDANQASQAVASAHRHLVAVETYQLRLAAHWLDRHAPTDHPDTPTPLAAPRPPGGSRGDRCLRAPNG